MNLIIWHRRFLTVGTAFITCSMLFYACKEKYLPNIKDVNPNYVVIDGFINTGADSTIFKISRTFKLESKAVVTPERGAIVAVESDGGLSFVLPELSSKPGTYAVPALNLSQSQKYRLRVRTKDSKEYLSDFVESKVSPPVTLTYDFRHDNLNIYANTEDATGKSRYYNYTYTETWQYRSKQLSLWRIENHQLFARTFPEYDIYNCFHYAPSRNITIASTTSLTEDRLADKLLVDIPSNSEKVGIEYSILVKQNVLTKDGFEFFNTLKKNTESVGSIFDAQPSQLFGNIRCTTNPADVVVGFISAGTVTEKRITLIANEFPFTFKGPLLDSYCEEQVDTLFIAGGAVQRLLLDPTESEYIPLVALTGPRGILCLRSYQRTPMRRLQATRRYNHCTALLETLTCINVRASIYTKPLRTALGLVVVTCATLGACKEKYLPQIKDNTVNYLVVEGLINTGNDSTIFKLTRTFKLDNKAVVAPEKAAVVTVESDGGLTYTLPELPLKAGVYATPALNLDQSKKYRLRVRTKDNKEYLSEFVESKVSPPVELTYDFRHGNLNIYANTHDASGKSRYYNYTYTETWQYRAYQESFIKLENKELKYRTYPQDDIYNCFHHVPSGKITITTTATLAEDKLADNLLVDILPSSQKVKIEYSLLVKQNVLTKEGFEFFERLKKNTEAVGSIFDAQPSQIYSNITCTTNPADVVIGFVSAGTVTQKRIILLANDFPFDFAGPPIDQNCEDNAEVLDGRKQQAVLIDPAETAYIPIQTYPDPWRQLPNTITATAYLGCVDCRLQGGTTIVPPYWKH